MKRTRKLNEEMGGAQGKCPVPGCNHICNYYTKHHAETVHGMTREALFKKYGEPVMLLQKPRSQRLRVL